MLKYSNTFSLPGFWFLLFLVHRFPLSALMQAAEQVPGGTSGSTGGTGSANSLTNPEVLLSPSSLVSTIVSGSTSGNADYFYKIPVNNGQQYNFSLSNLNKDFNLYVYSASNFTGQLCVSSQGGTLNESCPMVTGTSSGFFYIKIKNFAGLTGPYTLTVGLVTPNSVGNPQAIASPVNGTPTTINGSTSGISDYFYSIPVTSGQQYTISLSNLSLNSNQDLYVYSDTYVTLLCSSVQAGNANESCSTTATSRFFYIKIKNAAGVTGTYTLSVKMVVGIISNPEVLSAPTSGIPTTINGSTSGAANYYYKVPVSLGQQYTVNLTNLSLTSNQDLFVYSDTYVTLLCSSAQVGNANESCSTTATSGFFFIKIQNVAGITGSYTLSIAQIGSSGNPEPLVAPTSATPATINGSTTGASNYYYKIPVTFGQTYAVSISNMSANMDLRVYSDVYSFMMLCSSSSTGTATDSCVAAGPLGGFLYVHIQNTAGVSATYTLTVTEAPVGSFLNPASISSIPASWSGSGTLTGNYYYKVSVTSGQSYGIILSNMTNNMDLYVYSDSGFSTQLCFSAQAGSLRESCAANGPAGGFLYVKILNTSGVSANYTLDVILSTLGTITNPEVLNAPSIITPTNINGSVPSNVNYYYKVPVTPGQRYLVNLSNMVGNDLHLYVYNNSTFSSALGYSNLATGWPDGCVITGPANGFIYVEIYSYVMMGVTTTFNLSISYAPTTFLFTNGDSTPELSGIPSAAVTTIAAGTTLAVTVPVDTDTGYVMVSLQNLGLVTTTAPMAKASSTITPGTVQTTTVYIPVPRFLPLSTYQLVVDLAATSAAYNAISPTYTSYHENAGSMPSFWREQMLNGMSSGTYADSHIDSIRISVTAASVAPATTAIGSCGIAKATPASFSVPTLPSGWSGASPSAYGSCYYIITMPAANTWYSINLENLTNNQDLFGYESTWTKWLGISLNSGNFPDFISIQSDVNNKIYLQVYDSSGLSGSPWAIFFN